MSVTKKDTEYVAALARLGLTEEEKDLYTDQLNSILSYVDVINTAKTDDIAPSAYSSITGRSTETPMREDIAVKFEDTASILKNAPQQEDGMFRVPRIMEE